VDTLVDGLLLGGNERKKVRILLYCNVVHDNRFECYVAHILHVHQLRMVNHLHIFKDHMSLKVDGRVLYIE